MATLADHSVLLVDDNSDFAETLARALERGGYRVDCVASVAKAVEFLERKSTPSFVLLDRVLEDIPIETSGLAQLSAVGRDSLLVVYTNKSELSQEQEKAILERGAIRILDKQAVNALVGDVEKLRSEFGGLLVLSRELRDLTAERGRIAAALVGAGVGLTVVDEKYRCWFANSIQESLIGGPCSGGRCWVLFHGHPNDFGPCWGCTVAQVFNSGQNADRLFLSRFRSGTLRWVSVRSVPITDDAGKVVAVREAVRELPEAFLASLSPEDRLTKIAQGLIHVGFGRARIYQVSETGKLVLMAAAAASDDVRKDPGQYFRDFPHPRVPMTADECPYARQALDQHRANLVPSWYLEGKTSPRQNTLGLEPPYFDVPVWGSNGRLCGWLAVDFVGLEESRRDAAIERYRNDATLQWLSEGYGREIRRAMEARPMDAATQRRLEIIGNARLSVGGARSVDEALGALRQAFKELFPECAVSVRVLVGETLRQEPRLSIGDLSLESPDSIELSNSRSLAAHAVNLEINLLIDDYAAYREQAKKSGAPMGYPAEDIRSTAQVPLKVEQTVWGSLSIDSKKEILWEEDHFDGPVQMLANLTALALRDLNLDAAERDRAAMKAYASKLTGNILRETSDSRLLMWIFTEARGCIELLDKRRVDRKTLATSLERVRQLAAEARTGPSLERDSSPCKLENVIENIRKDNEPHKRYLELPKLESSFPLAAPEFAVRSILQCLIQNAVEAIELGDEKARKDGFVKLEVTGADDYVDVTVTDNGPGIPRKIEERILREPVESHTGRGTGLLVARGAALVAGGDLSLEIPRDKTVFRLRLPKLRKR